MKYIARCALIKDYRCIASLKCRCVMLHDLSSSCNKHGYIDVCQCVPVPLSYYMKEILKKEDKK